MTTETVREICVGGVHYDLSLPGAVREAGRRAAEPNLPFCFCGRPHEPAEAGRPDLQAAFDAAWAAAVDAADEAI